MSNNNNIMMVSTPGSINHIKANKSSYVTFKGEDVCGYDPSLRGSSKKSPRRNNLFEEIQFLQS